MDETYFLLEGKPGQFGPKQIVSYTYGLTNMD